MQSAQPLEHLSHCFEFVALLKKNPLGQVVFEALTHWLPINWAPAAHEVQLLAARKQVLQLAWQGLHLPSASTNWLTRLVTFLATLPTLVVVLTVRGAHEGTQVLFNREK
jgi:hypothetical protein